MNYYQVEYRDYLTKRKMIAATYANDEKELKEKMEKNYMTRDFKITSVDKV